MNTALADNLSAFAGAFPLLRNAGASLHYLDNAATTHKPDAVIDAISACYRETYAPIHRGLYPLAEGASDLYEHSRQTVATFIGAPSPNDVIFTRSATEAINLVARGWATQPLAAGKNIWVTRLEHHANYLPWQAACSAAGSKLNVIELNADGTLDLDGAKGLFSPQTGLIAVSMVSNVLGSIQPIKRIIQAAHEHGIAVLVDASQAAGHIPINVKELGCDFLALSGHKMYGPAGIGVLYGRTNLLEQTEPLLLGGGMVDWVGDRTSQWSDLPHRLEAGSPNLTGAAGLAAAIDFLAPYPLAELHAHVQQLAREAYRALNDIPGVTLYTPDVNQVDSGILAFNVADVHPHDLGQVAGELGVAMRAGHHCCQPLMHHLGVPATARVSFAPYNTSADVEALIRAVHEAMALFG